ncbi:hypothetical protein FPZ12_009165 [Amycolatopsis acidicola]|uniref:Mammalian cell entry protein n=1 Tax=Amycolatopsis acidicola TaxID=2596893 RepID=A0A5N0VDI3_9PSEU|nr:hypothetical protein [Amycolatopsis acidicola]KAA9163658.1 hypothetical protein FPZ12_009165 [Amycolatopsis acidicola]
MTVTEEAPAEVEEKPPPSPKRWLIGMLVLLLVLTAALVTGGILLRPVQEYRSAGDRRDAILAAAKDVAQLSYSLDYETFPQQSSKIAGATTGSYRQGLLDSSQGLGSILSQGKVKSNATITAAGVEKDDANTATVLMSITVQITNTELKTPQTRYYRVAIGLVRQGAQWLVQSNDVIA